MATTFQPQSRPQIGDVSSGNAHYAEAYCNRTSLAPVKLFALFFVFIGLVSTSPHLVFGQGEEDSSSESYPNSHSGGRSSGTTGIGSGFGKAFRGMFGSKDPSNAGVAEETSKPDRASSGQREARLLKPGAFQNRLVKQFKAVTDPNPGEELIVEGLPTKSAFEASNPAASKSGGPSSTFQIPTPPSKIAQQPYREPFTTNNGTVNGANSPAALTRPQGYRSTDRPMMDPPSLVGTGVSTTATDRRKQTINRFTQNSDQINELPKPLQPSQFSTSSGQSNESRPLPEVVSPSQVVGNNQGLGNTTTRTARSVEAGLNVGDSLNRRLVDSGATSRRTMGVESKSDDLMTTKISSRPVPLLTTDPPSKRPLSTPLDSIQGPRSDTASQATESLTSSKEKSTEVSLNMDLNLPPVAKKPVPLARRDNDTDTSNSSRRTIQNNGNDSLGYDIPKSNYSITSKQPVAPEPSNRNSTVVSSITSARGNATSTRSENLNSQTKNPSVAIPTTASASPSLPLVSGSRLDMSIPKVRLFVAGPTALQVGKSLPYEVILRNEGTELLSGVIVSMGVPAGVAASAFVSTAGEFESEKDETGNQTILWHVSELGPSQSRIFRLTLEAAKPVQFAMDLEWTVLPQSGHVQIAVEQPQLSLALEGPSDVLWGKPELYRLRVKNPGNALVKDVQVKLTADTYGSNQSSIGDIPAGGERVVEVELTFQQTGTIPIVGEASSQAQSLESKSSIDVAVNQIKLESEWNAPSQQYLGSVADYQVTIHNRSNIASDNLICTVPIPQGLSVVSLPPGATTVGKEIRWKEASIDANTTKSYSFTFQANESIKTKLHLDAKCNGNGATSAEAIASIDSISDLKLSVIDPVAPAPVGRDVQYDLVIVNRGSRPAKAVKVVAQFSSGIEPVRAEGVSAKLVPGQVLFDAIDSIGPGEQVTLRVVAQATEAGVHRFRAELDCEDGDTQLIEEESTRYLATSRTDPAKPTIRR